MEDKLKKRAIHIQIFFALAAAVLIGKAMQLQIIDQRFQDRAESTTIHKVTVRPARGSVFDRNNKLMVYNIPIYDLMVTYNQIDPEMDTLKFCRILGISEETFVKNLEKNWASQAYSRSVPFIFLNRLSIETYARFQESLYEFPGFFVQLKFARGYEHPHAAHVLGYLREVNGEEVANSDGEYVPGDHIGATGIEKAYDNELRGKKGYKYVLKDNLGREVESYMDGTLDSMNRAKPGKDLILSLDLELQAFCESLMKNKKGGIVAIEPSTGEVLSMLSSPSYDPNLLVFNRNRGKPYRELLLDPDKPFYNRAVLASYPPGSIFKSVVALIALQEGVTPVEKTIPCYRGYWMNGKVQMGCHEHVDCKNIPQAIQHSCNAYFAHVFRSIIDQEGYTKPQIGLDRFNSYLQSFGIGSKLGIDFPSEGTGSFPTSSYYNKRYAGERWYSPYIMSVGIGQGEMLLTTLQLANLAAIMANRGHYVTPHLVKGFQEQGTVAPVQGEYRLQHSVNIDKEHFEVVVDGMERVVRAGTAWSSFIPEIPICGKTGTVQNPHGEDHSTFFAFAPKDDPKIAVAVYVEHGISGGYIAAPIASLIVEKYLTGEISKKRAFRENFVKNLDLMPKEEEQKLQIAERD